MRKTLGILRYLNTFFSKQKKMRDVEDKIMSIFKRNATKEYSKPTRVNNVNAAEKKARISKIKKETIR